MMYQRAKAHLINCRHQLFFLKRARASPFPQNFQNIKKYSKKYKKIKKLKNQ